RRRRRAVGVFFCGVAGSNVWRSIDIAVGGRAWGRDRAASGAGLRIAVDGGLLRRVRVGVAKAGAVGDRARILLAGDRLWRAALCLGILETLPHACWTVESFPLNVRGVGCVWSDHDC